MKDKQFLQTAWKKYIYTNRLETRLDAVVKASWERSAAYGVNPHQEAGPIRYPSKGLSKLREKNQHLLELSLPLMQQVYDLVKGSGFVVTLCDRNGILIKVVGDEAPLSKAEEIQFVEGADWSESAVGTNAIGTSIITGHPLQIFASEHYSKACQWWTCSASPIRDVSGTIIGVLNMSGPFEQVHTHTLGMIVSAVAAIENQLIVEEKTRNNQLMQRYLESAINTLPEAVLVLNQDYDVIRVNQTFLQLTGLQEDSLVDAPVAEILSAPELPGLLHGGMEIVDREVSLKVMNGQRDWNVLLNLKPISDGAGDPMGALLTLRDLAKVRQFVNHMTDRNAKVTFADILGESPIFLECLRDARIASNCDSTVLLTGESGTGKDLIAQAIHGDSLRKDQPFIAINCGAIPRDLLGSELFGYSEGAFTGAKRGGSAGKFELADGGTLFLDEVGEMSLEMQVHLLRVLQNQEVSRIGSNKVTPVNVRIIAATNMNLADAVKKGLFRRDLFYRLNVMPIQVPTLRQRRDDIPRLTRVFVQQLSQRLNRPIRDVGSVRAVGSTRAVDPVRDVADEFGDSEFIEALMMWDWPGNIRELQNVLERAILTSNGEVLTVKDLPSEMQRDRHSKYGAHHASNHRTPIPLKEETKRRALLESIEASHGNLKAAARRLGIARSTLYRQLDKYGLR